MLRSWSGGSPAVDGPQNLMPSTAGGVSWPGAALTPKHMLRATLQRCPAQQVPAPADPCVVEPMMYGCRGGRGDYPLHFGHHAAGLCGPGWGARFRCGAARRLLGGSDRAPHAAGAAATGAASAACVAALACGTVAPARVAGTGPLPQGPPLPGPAKFLGAHRRVTRDGDLVHFECQGRDFYSTPRRIWWQRLASRPWLPCGFLGTLQRTSTRRASRDMRGEIVSPSGTNIASKH